MEHSTRINNRTRVHSLPLSSAWQIGDTGRTLERKRKKKENLE